MLHSRTYNLIIKQITAIKDYICVIIICEEKSVHLTHVIWKAQMSVKDILLINDVEKLN